MMLPAMAESGGPGAGPLAGLVVIDLTWVLAGPFTAMILRDLGARVIKVERPPYGDVARTTGPYLNDESCYFFSINRGKESICLDLRSPEGRELFLRLVEKADVLLENFTPGTMERLNLGFDSLSRRNPGLIYAATSGFGQTGPERERPALDIVVQGMGGIMSITGEPGGPPLRPGVSQADITAGLYTAIGVLAALHERQSSGRGQFIDVSMLDCQVALLENAFVRYFVSGEVPQPLATRHPSATPFQALPTGDGWLVLALNWGVENQWELFCAAIDRVDLIDDPRFVTSHLRTVNHSQLEPLLVDALSKRPAVEWLRDFQEIGLPCGPVNNIAQVAEHPQVKAREMLVDVEHPAGFTLKLPNSPIKLSRTPAGIRGRSPAIGEHTDAVLGEMLSIGQEELAALRLRGAIAGPLPSPVPLVLAAGEGDGPTV